MNLSEIEKEDFQLLLMAAIDGELSAEEQARFEEYLHRDSICRKEWQDYSRLKTMTAGIKFIQPSPEVWKQYRNSIAKRIQHRVHWLFPAIGSSVALIFLVIKISETLLTDPNLQLVFKTGILVILVCAMLLVIPVTPICLWMLRLLRIRLEY
jgi:hypothetical protein